MPTIVAAQMKEGVENVAREGHELEPVDVVVEGDRIGDPDDREGDQLLIDLERAGHEPEEGDREDDGERDQGGVGHGLLDRPARPLADLAFDNLFLTDCCRHRCLLWCQEPP